MFYLFVNFLILPLNEFLQPEIKQKWLQLMIKKYHEFSLDIFDIAFHFSLWFKLNSFFNLVLLSPGIQKRETEKNYLKVRNYLRDKFSRIFVKFAKLNPREKSTGSQFAKLNPREKKKLFFVFSELAKLTFLV